MLENKAPSRLGSYIIFGVLMTILCFFIYPTAEYKQAYKWRGVEISFMKNQMEDQKDVEKSLKGAIQQWYSKAMYYEQMLNSGVVILKEGQIFVKKGTLIIPPRQEPKKQTPESQ